MNFFVLSFADPSLGKVDKFSLSQQTLMELLVEGFIHKENIWGDSGETKDISEWNKVKLSAAHVIRLDWGYLELGGSIELKWLPLSVHQCFFQGNALTGTADLTCLPDGLDALSLSNNSLGGTVDLTKLPKAMRCLFLYRNNFYGETDFSQLPQALTQLDVADTQLEGEVFAYKGSLKAQNSKVKDMRKKWLIDIRD